MCKRPPRGVLPLELWKEDNPDPSVKDLLLRYQEVVAAIDRYRRAKLPIRDEWLDEVGLINESQDRTSI
jgi:hypothetical protein